MPQRPPESHRVNHRPTRIAVEPFSLTAAALLSQEPPGSFRLVPLSARATLPFQDLVEIPMRSRPSLRLGLIALCWPIAALAIVGRL